MNTTAQSCTDHEAGTLLGYSFRQPQLLEEALTHKSHVNEARDKSRKDNERLEFLGDAVLSLIISEHLAASSPGSTEGMLSKHKAHLVSEASLAKAARGLDLGNLLRLGRGEELTQGREKPSLLANALEALIGSSKKRKGRPAFRITRPSFRNGVRSGWRRCPNTVLSASLARTTRRRLKSS